MKAVKRRRGNGLRRGATLSDHAAHHAVELALVRGELVRPDQCENCGEAPSTFSNGAHGVQAHHDDYNHPLVVRWLCKSCHHRWHRLHIAIPKREPVVVEGLVLDDFAGDAGDGLSAPDDFAIAEDWGSDTFD